MSCIKKCWCKTLSKGTNMRSEIPITSERMVLQNAMRDIATLSRQYQEMQIEFRQKEKHLIDRVNHLETLVFNYRSIIDSLSITVNHLLITRIKDYQCEVE